MNKDEQKKYSEMSFEDKQKFWEEVTGNDDLKLIGKVSNLDKENCEVKNLRNFKTREILNEREFKGINITSIEQGTINSKIIDDEVKEKGIKVGDEVSFKLYLSSKSKKGVYIKEKSIEPLNKTVKDIQSYLANDEEKPLNFNEETITHFYAGLRTDQLLVLAGPPGSGKTSLVEGFCKATNSELRMIPVQPNWIDRSDLLGFYNPLEKTYIPTPFLDALLEAGQSENKEQLFIICLDEMNLAHVEYYFAEFLSKMQTDRTIQLYSETIKEEIEKELKELTGYFEVSDINSIELSDFYKINPGVDINHFFQMKKQQCFIENYPPNLTVPNNVRFIGTINKDATTKDLSPKVVDRSYLMKIIPYEKDEYKYQNHDNKEVLQLKIQDFAVNNELVHKNINEFIDDLTIDMEKYNIRLTNRFRRTVKQLSGSEMFDDNDLKDVILSSLVLPKINKDKYEIEIDKLIKTLKDDIQKHNLNISRRILADMEVKDLDSNTINALTYWR